MPAVGLPGNRVPFTSYNPCTRDAGLGSLCSRLMPRARGWNHPNPTRIGIGEFQRLVQQKALSGSIGDHESRAHARISSDSPTCPKTERLDGGCWSLMRTAL